MMISEPRWGSTAGLNLGSCWRDKTSIAEGLRGRLLYSVLGDVYLGKAPHPALKLMFTCDVTSSGCRC